MANKQRGFVSVKLDKQRKFKFTFNAFCELEDELGRPVTEIEKGFKMKDLRTMVWAGLLHEEPDLTVEEAGELIDEADSITSVSDAVAQAVKLAMGPEAEAATGK